MNELKNYENYPWQIKRICHFLLEAKAKYPDVQVDCGGQITYANGNDSTEFDWDANDRLCEFGWGVPDGSAWTFKCLVDRWGTAEIYCYPNGEFKPVEKLEKQLFDDGAAEDLYRIMCEHADHHAPWDTTLDVIFA